MDLDFLFVDVLNHSEFRSVHDGSCRSGKLYFENTAPLIDKSFRMPLIIFPHIAFYDVFNVLCSYFEVPS